MRNSVLAICGSASLHSANEKLLQVLAQTKNWNVEIFTGLKSLPHFDPEVTGAYHSNLRAAVEGNTLKIFTTAPDAVKVEQLLQRYECKEFGLAPQTLGPYHAKTLYPGIVREISVRTEAGLQRT